MVPACFIRLDALPASPNGKHDRKALPAPPRAGGTPPREGVERCIAEIWQTLLRVSGIGRDDSFFRLGGNSILAVRMQAQLRDTLGIDPEKFNVNGGAIAMGHPLGATGAMITGIALDELERSNKSTALITLCIGGGMGTATVIERV